VSGGWLSVCVIYVCQVQVVVQGVPRVVKHYVCLYVYVCVSVCACALCMSGLRISPGRTT